MRIRSFLTVMAVASSLCATYATAEDPVASPSPAVEHYAPMVVDENIPDFKGEDSLTKLEHLDELLLQTHRQLSIARTQEQPKETIEKLEKKVEKINEQRVAMMKKLNVKH